jgi:hypothetical protein
MVKTKQNPLTVECIDKIGAALKMFGSYSFDDKGPNEVMDIDELETKFRALPAAEAAAVLLEVNASKKHSGRGNYLVSELCIAMQDWDDLFASPGMENLEW